MIENAMTQPDIPHEKKKARNGYYSIPAIDPHDKGVWEVLISHQTIIKSKNYGMQLASELAHMVPLVLEKPCAIFQGIRWDADEEKATDVPGWFCYCGLPGFAVDRNGREIDAYEDKVYLVFVNADRVVYHYRWDYCCPDNPRLPIGHNDPVKPRFRERIL